MQHKFKFLAAGAVAAAVGLTAFQVSAQVDPVARRKGRLKGFGAQNGTLSGMAQGRVPFDLARAKAALNVLAMGGNELPGLFPGDGPTGETAALPAVWTNKADFNAKATAFAAAAGAARDSITDEASFKAALGSVGSGCGGCHSTYRARPAAPAGGGAPAPAARPAT